MPESAAATQFEIGTYLCPNNLKLVPLLVSQPIMSVQWPIIVRNCSSCGEVHVVNREDLHHPPVFGYE